uniref:Uncharacterized protein n=1 Tax=Xiphophorus couchianus TaxID=32473 RepID=A0A3B5MIQ4_9TELE
MTLTTETGHQNLTTVIGDEGRDLLAVLDELDSHTLPDGRVGLLGLDTDDALGVRGSSEGVGLQGCPQVSLLVLFVMPFLLTPVIAELPGDTLLSSLASILSLSNPLKTINIMHPFCIAHQHYSEPLGRLIYLKIRIHAFYSPSLY